MSVPAWTPFLDIPLTVQLIVIVDDDAKSTVPFWPLFAMGTKMTAVNFNNVRPELFDGQLLTIGFVNRECKLLAQARTMAGVLTILDNFALPSGMHRVHLVLDHSYMRLYVNGKLRGEVQGSLQRLAYNEGEQTLFGNGENGVMSSCTIRKALSEGEIETALHPHPPRNLSGWEKNNFGVVRSFLHGEPTTFANVWHSTFFCELFETEDRLESLLSAFGDSVANYPSRQDASRTASRKISEITAGLTEIVNDPTKLEPELLAFFKDTPGAAFLLEPDVTEQWREHSIQNYGRIDFVFKRSDGSFRVVEIERTTRQLFKEDDEKAADLNHAISQVDKWIRGAGKSPQITLHDFGVSGAELFHGLVVIGRASEITNSERREVWHATKQKISVQTWDDIIARGQLMAQRLSDPELNGYRWAKD